MQSRRNFNPSLELLQLRSVALLSSTGQDLWSVMHVRWNLKDSKTPMAVDVLGS